MFAKALAGAALTRGALAETLIAVDWFFTGRFKRNFTYFSAGIAGRFVHSLFAAISSLRFKALLAKHRLVAKRLKRNLTFLVALAANGLMHGSWACRTSLRRIPPHELFATKTSCFLSFRVTHRAAV